MTLSPGHHAAADAGALTPRTIHADTSNKQLAFVEHIVRALKPGGRAAMVVPDNVLFEDNIGRRLDVFRRGVT